MSEKQPFKKWKYVNLYGDWKIGENTRIGSFCDIGGVVGKNCVVQCHVSIPPKTVIGDSVFIGPGVRFANEKHMMSGNLEGTQVEDGVKIGMGALIGPNLIIGKDSVIGMGAVVLDNVPPGETWIGNPARKIEKEERPMTVYQSPTLDQLDEFEKVSWPSEHQAPRDALAKRLETFPEGIFLMEENGLAVSQVTVSPKHIPQEGILGFEQMRDVPVDRTSKILWITNLATRQGMTGRGYMSRLFSQVIRWAKNMGYHSIMTGVTCSGLAEAMWKGITPTEYMARGMNPGVRSLENASSKNGLVLEAGDPIEGYWPDDKDSAGYGVIIQISLLKEGEARKV